MHPDFYLKSLIIQNFATFKNQTITFRPGFNAIVGETGSGKSLVLDALELILGGRADKKVVRRETDYSLVEASFYCRDLNIKAFLETEGYPIEADEIIIKRLIYKNGSTKTYINHLSCTVNFLAGFTRKYIDLVGQFENQKLLSESYQLFLLDHFAKHLPDVSTYQTMLKEFKALAKKLQALNESRLNREQRLDYLNFQLQEIDKLNPTSQDEEDLLKKKNLLMNFEKTRTLALQAKAIFEGSDSEVGIISQMKYLHSLFVKNPDLFSERVDLFLETEEKIHELHSYLEKKLEVDLDEKDLEYVLDRLDSYQKLKRKFGGSVEGILQAQVEFMKERSELEGLELNLEEFEINLKTLEKELWSLAEGLHQKRKVFTAKLGQELTKRVRQLKMNGATLKLNLEKVEELGEAGFSRVSFIAETNPGEGFFKIKDIASGGELSRFLLAVRQILSAYDSISIFLFDEIDTGIGGDTANCIGKALSEVASHGQVIAITHLPQIAQFAEVLIVVNKEILEDQKESRTESNVKEIFGKMIMREVKAMAQLA